MELLQFSMLTMPRCHVSLNAPNSPTNSTDTIRPICASRHVPQVHGETTIQECAWISAYSRLLNLPGWTETTTSAWKCVPMATMLTIRRVSAKLPAPMVLLLMTRLEDVCIIVLLCQHHMPRRLVVLEFVSTTAKTAPTPPR